MRATKALVIGAVVGLLLALALSWRLALSVD
jgi:hypothetical protein